MAHTHQHTASGNATRRLLLAFIITALFMVVEVIGGIVSGSLALLADAGHMLTDSAALLVALIAVYIARRPANDRHTFGWLRLPTLAAFVNALALIIITVLIVQEAIQRFYQPQPVAGWPMLIIALAGLLANLVAFWILNQGTDKKNMNVRAAALHVLGDLLGSVGAIIAALVILWSGWTPIDPILSVLVSCLVLRSAWSLLKESLHELLEGAPLNIDIPALKHHLSHSIPEVRSVHHIHLWMVGEQPLMSLHVQAIPTDDHDGLLGSIHSFLVREYQIEHATVQVEYRSCSLPECRLNEHDHLAGGHDHHH